MSLLEVMVAFVIAALSLGVVIGGTVDGLRTADGASRTEEALFRARSRLAATPPVSATASGDDGGGFRWRSAVTSVAAPARDGAPTLMSVQVTVTWSGADGAARQVTLRTERLVAAPAP